MFTHVTFPTVYKVASTQSSFPFPPFPMYARTTPPSFSPHSSPPSSPSLYYNDSSPPSSPGLEPLDPPYDIAFDNSASGNLAHPYAASAKAGRALRAYEKKPVTSHTADDREPAKKYRRLYSDAIGLEVDEDIDLDLDIPEVHMSAAAAEDKEKALWDSAIASVFDSSQGSLDLACVVYCRVVRAVLTKLYLS